ncbi:MAG: hypothetical protein LC803_00015 [Acidobacteria bacterium]|nr:hypothetical protein [Acidobacteriota bacterium]
MPRRHVSTAHIFTGLLGLLITLILTIIVTVNVNAQSNIPTKLGVSSARRTVGVGEQTQLRIRLLDQTGNETAATYDTNITLIATRQRDIDSAKREGRGSASLQRHGTLALPGGVNTVQTAVTIRQGHAATAVRFSSEHSGLVRIYAENEKLVTGATLIAVVNKTGKASPRDGATANAGIFKLASLQEPSTLAAPAAPRCRLSIEPVGETNPVLNERKEYVRSLTLVLRKQGNEDPCPAPQEIKVHLSVVGGAAPSKNVVIIPKGEVIDPSLENIEVRTKSGGSIEVAALLMTGSELVLPAPKVALDFPTNIRATKLLVRALQPTAMANGVESITLLISPVDDGNNLVRNQYEGLKTRNIALRIASPTPGLKFNGETIIQFKKDDDFVKASVVSSYPVVGAQIIAESLNGDQQWISGEGKVEFCFPWPQLGGAMFGGLMFPLLLTVFPGKQRKQRFAGGKLRMISLYGVAGLFLGALAFALVFFGALGLTELNFNGIPISLARLPIHNVLAACAIGFFGGVTLASCIALKERAQAEPAAGDSPARA